MEPAEHIAALRREGAAVATAARSGLDAPVPSCPDWTVADLVAHLGVAHRWATANVREPSDQLVRGARHKWGVEASDPRLLEWFDEGVAEFLANWSSTRFAQHAYDSPGGAEPFGQ